MTVLALNIRGFAYNVLLYTVKEFEALYGPDTDAICSSSTYSLIFKVDAIDKATIGHELCHAYLNGSLLESSSLDVNQFEEAVCEVMGHFYSEYVANIELIYEALVECKDKVI